MALNNRSKPMQVLYLVLVLVLVVVVIRATTN